MNLSLLREPIDLAKLQRMAAGYTRDPRQMQMDTGYRQTTPGYGEFATESINTLAPSPLDAAGLVPGLGDAADIAQMAHAMNEGRMRDAALYGTAAMIPFVSGSALGSLATWGIKRHPEYWHGTKEEHAPAILREGFQKGQSAELKLPGTSISEDPLVSYRSEFAGGNPLGMLRVDVGIPPERVRNLSPYEYQTGVVPQEPNAVYRKPNLFYREAETFGLRERNMEAEAAWKQRNEELKEQFRAAQLAQQEAMTLMQNPRQTHLGPGEIARRYREALNNTKRLRSELDAHQSSSPAQTPPPFDARRATPEEIARVKQQKETFNRFETALKDWDRTWVKDETGGWTQSVKSPAEKIVATKQAIADLLALQGNRGTLLEALDKLNTENNAPFWNSFNQLAGKDAAKEAQKWHEEYLRSAYYAQRYPDDVRFYQNAMRAKDELLNVLRPYAGVRPPSNPYYPGSQR